ncbi:TadE/TadG family type IV pilus assembly protein [Thalassoglobus polymorphus]|uniref:TadE-like protein n=1 Tax=Thalassoglobus polymorphus TaxID=2527994 RepID=A0A517QT29_9PLAN|nr:TadE/TadG family type IV pilus assembly protein [Thalassoglobus polymorphus]QDT34789.1 TadE-like protein [Thalassoglobus polymorphus]
MRRNLNNQNRSRRGFVSLEVVLVLPMFMVLLLGLCEFSLLFTAQGQVVESARAGARIATLHGVDDVIVEEEVRKTLSRSLGTYARVESQLGKYSGDEVIVQVRVPMASVTPDLLWPIGYSVRGREVIAVARMRKE